MADNGENTVNVAVKDNSELNTIAVGVAAVFIETHDNPAKALSDGPNMIPLHDMKRVLSELQAYDKITKSMIHDY